MAVANQPSWTSQSSIDRCRPPRPPSTSKPSSPRRQQLVYDAIQATPTKIHASIIFQLPIQQIVDAAMNNQLEGVPFLSKPELIRKYLPPSPATPKGRMKRPRTVLRSTRKKVARMRKVATMRRAKQESEPNEKNGANNIF